MKVMNIVLACALILGGTFARAELKGSPFPPHIDQRFNEIEGGDSAVSASEGLGVKNIAIATWDYSKDGAASSVGTYDLGVTLPANAVVTRSFLYAVNAVTSGHVLNQEPTWGLTCGAKTLFTAAELANRTPNVGFFLDAASTGLSAAFVNIPTRCNLTANIASGDFTGGRVSAILEYVVHE